MKPFRVAGAAVSPNTSSVYNVSYAPASSWDVNPMYNSPGHMWVQVTNTGSATWAANTIAMGYHLQLTNGTWVNKNGLSTEITTDVPPGYAVNVYSSIQELSAGSYVVDWDLVTLNDPSGQGFWSTLYGDPASYPATSIQVPHYPPTAVFSSPADRATVSSTVPRLEIIVQADGTLQNNAEFDVCTGPGQGYTCWDSGWLPVSWTQGSFSAVQIWTPPANMLYWNTTYYWQIRVQDSAATTPWSSWSSFTPVLPPPNAQLGSGGSQDNLGVGLYRGDYTRDEKDLAFAVPGYTLPMEWFYNSLNKANGAFGTGWSSVLDIHRTMDASFNVTVTFPDGRQVAYGLNPNGTYTAGEGETGEGRVISEDWLIMPGNVTYLFDHAGGWLSEIIPPGVNATPIMVTRDSLNRVTALTASTPGAARTLTVTYVPNANLVASVTSTGTTWPRRRARSARSAHDHCR